MGRTEPRLSTPPLRELTPDTSYGFAVIDFARDVLNEPLRPWQEHAVIRIGELLPDGRPRFRRIIVVVARQNGKTTLAKVLILYWMFVELVPLVLGTSTDRSYAKRTWTEVCNQAKANAWTKGALGPGAVHKTIGEENLSTLDGSEYTFKANNSSAGRSMTVHRWVCDELRHHTNWDAWSAASRAQNAVRNAQTLCITNMGDDTSVVLDSLRTSAIEYIETGQGDPRLGLLEWSAPPGSDPTDMDALAYANPGLGYDVDPDALLGDAITCKRSGGIELAEFRTEVMCQRVHHMDSAIDPDLWLAAGTDTPMKLSDHRDKVALCLDVSRDSTHASLVAAAVIEGQVHVEVVAHWDGFGCTKQLRTELPGIVAKVRPRRLGWFPKGPAAAIAPDVKAPPRVEVAELGSDVTAACMGLAEQVTAGELVHPRDPMLDAHVYASQKLPRGDGWVFARRGAAPIDGTYALAGAVLLARTLPPAPPPLVVLGLTPRR